MEQITTKPLDIAEELNLHFLSMGERVLKIAYNLEANANEKTRGGPSLGKPANLANVAKMASFFKIVYNLEANANEQARGGGGGGAC